MRYFLCFLLAVPPFLFGCSSNRNKEYVFGSDLIQSRLWTKEELAGQAGDENIVRNNKRAYENLEVGFDYHIATNRQWPNQVKQYHGSSVRRVNLPEDKKLISLTLDLCEPKHETTGYQRKIFNYLRAHEIKATIFAGGKWMNSHPDKAMQLMADPIFEMANHSWTHVNFRMIDENAALRQVVWTQEKYKELRDLIVSKARSVMLEEMSDQNLYQELESIPDSLYLFRFPFGSCSKRNLQLTKKLNMPAIQWDVVSGDSSSGSSAEKIAGRILEYSRPGSIIVMHANGRGIHSAEALALFIPQLRKQGYQFVTVSELLRASQSIEAAESCYEIRPGDAGRIDLYNGISGHGDP